MKKYNVICTAIYNGEVEVIAKNEEDAIDIAMELMGEGSYFPRDIKIGAVDFYFGEATADYADEIKED